MGPAPFPRPLCGSRLRPISAHRCLLQLLLLLRGGVTPGGWGPSRRFCAGLRAGDFPTLSPGPLREVVGTAAPAPSSSSERLLLGWRGGAAPILLGVSPRTHLSLLFAAARAPAGGPPPVRFPPSLQKSEESASTCRLLRRVEDAVELVGRHQRDSRPGDRAEAVPEEHAAGLLAGRVPELLVVEGAPH